MLRGWQFDTKTGRRLVEGEWTTHHQTVHPSQWVFISQIISQTTHIRFPSWRTQGFPQLVLVYTNLQETARWNATGVSAITESQANLAQGMLPLICVLLTITIYFSSAKVDFHIHSFSYTLKLLRYA